MIKICKVCATPFWTWGLAVFLAVGLCAAPADAARNRSQASVARGELQVRGVILVDASTGKVLYEQDADRAVAPASLTKVASMYVAMDAISTGKLNMGDTVKVSRRAARQGGSRMFLKAGDKVSVERLLFGMAISSGNDASLAVAEKVAGSSAAFVKMMNRKMKALGLRGTTFKNVHGLPAKGQLTTARDMAKLSVAYLKTYPRVLRFHNTKAMRHNGVTTVNKNPLLRDYPGADGLKTGWVNASGYNVITTAKRGDVRLLAVVLGAPDSNTRARECRRIMDAGFLAVQKQATVSAVLGLGGKSERLVADNEKPKQKATVRKASNAKKKEQVRTSSATKKKQPAARNQNKKSKKQQAAVSNQKKSAKKSQQAVVRSPKEPAKASKQRQPTRNTRTNNGKSGWSASGSLMDS